MTNYCDDLWNTAADESDRTFGADYVSFANGAVWAAGWACAILGMAEAIRVNGPPIVKRHYWTSEIDGRHYYNCFCAAGCGTQMKMRYAGADENTDNEWCGACRY